MKETEEWRKRENLKRARIFCPKFMYFLKYSEPPPEVQPMSGGNVYKMTIYWDRPQDPTFKQKGGPEEYAIFVSREGTLKILRMIETKHIDVLVRKKRHDAYGNVNFYQSNSATGVAHSASFGRLGEKERHHR